MITAEYPEIMKRRTAIDWVSGSASRSDALAESVTVV
jgi:hypothetical protein